MNNCTETSNCYTVTVVGVNENELMKNIEIYPNPAQDFLQINILNNYKISCQVYTIEGQLIKSEILNKEINRINTTYLNTSIYILQLKFTKGVFKDEILNVRFIKN